MWLKGGMSLPHEIEALIVAQAREIERLGAEVTGSRFSLEEQCTLRASRARNDSFAMAPIAHELGFDGSGA